ncbi:peptidyl-tRNA hydrolase II domain-containing protein [Piptocephalis cylindrospora]|uniref:peptidyl-tRNA hydrolase n=1 Tax=Piptocephalis cylindrospora TaxID=1907219 RepID=A0A4V1IY49_9FUNG|nr:peptidyl-tRNA hydrolase II domain-containing protein [Piptocephalis cylindrospora]|eukprot:RKP13319.1 peptidyl-tRNA hydrolase II domain-containing protein [Piptocephalis cylindrospora]
MSAQVTAAAKSAERLTMFIILRKDLVEKEGWPIGAMMTQACHAATAALWTFRDQPQTIQYLQDIPNMTKVTLEVKSLTDLNYTAKALEDLHIPVYQWREQPEDLVTCLATSPILRSAAGKALKRVRLWK